MRPFPTRRKKYDGIAGSGLQVSVVMDSLSFGGTTNPAAQRIPECRLSQDMGSLLEQGVLTDVVLAVGPNQEVSAHKAILAGHLRFKLSSVSVFNSRFFFSFRTPLVNLPNKTVQNMFARHFA